MVAGADSPPLIRQLAICISPQSRPSVAKRSVRSRDCARGKSGDLASASSGIDRGSRESGRRRGRKPSLLRREQLPARLLTRDRGTVITFDGFLSRRAWIPLASSTRRTRRRGEDAPLAVPLGEPGEKSARVHGVQANWAYFMSRGVIYASLAAFSPRGNEMVITTLRFGDRASGGHHCDANVGNRGPRGRALD